MDYLKSGSTSQLLDEKGSDLVVINPGSANVRIGLASKDEPFIVPHCIAWHTTQVPKPSVQDQMLNSQVTTAQHIERERAYDVIASLLKIPFLDEELARDYPRKVGHISGHNPHSGRKDVPFAWTNVYDNNPDTSLKPESSVDKGVANGSKGKGVANESSDKDGVPTDSEGKGVANESDKDEVTDSKDCNCSEPKYRKFICGEEALMISPKEPYCLRRPIRRGHLNISQYYPAQQVIEDLHAIWDWILIEKLHIPLSERKKYSVILVVPETFDNREIKEILSIVLRDLQFSSAVVHQEGLAAIFGNGLPTACVVNLGAQVTSVVCIEDGAALPTTEKTLPFGGEDISRCLLWTQRHHQTWPQIRTDALAKPIDLLMLNKLKESYCQIKEGELDAVAVVHSYEDDNPAGSHKTRLTALNVPPMGLFYPMLLVPDVYPRPPRSWFHDYEDMLDDTWNIDFPRRPDGSESSYSSYNVGIPMWDSFPIYQTKPKKEEKVGLAEAITNSILLTGRIDLQKKLFCSIQLAGGVALTRGLVAAVEERVLHAIPTNEAINTVEVLQSRTNPSFVCWKGGALLGILDNSREVWIQRDDWICSGIHVGNGRKYKDSYFLQAQTMSYISS